MLRHDVNGDSSFTDDDPNWIDESLSKITPPDDIEVVKGIDSGTYKLDVNKDLFENKFRLISLLKASKTSTPSKDVALWLSKLFIEWVSRKDFWLYVAQHWPPRAINGVISQLRKQHERGDTSIRNPSAYFHFLIKKRKMRKKYRVPLVPVKS